MRGVAHEYRAGREVEESPALPTEPLVTIKPSGSWVGLDLRSLWEYRELLYFLTWREVKLRYRQTVLGAAWAVVQPLFMSLIFALFFGRLAGISSNGVPYLIFAYSGLLLWTFFANSVNNSGGSVVGNANLITKVYFPRLIIPGAAVGAMLVDFAVAFAVLALLMVFFGVVPTWGFLLLPVLIALTVLLALGFGTWMAALNVKYRDIRYALPFVIQISLFTSPVIYPANLLPEQLRLVYALNPLTGIIENWRAALFGLPFDWPTLAVSVAITLVLLAYSLHAFRQTEKSFADVI